MELQIDTTEYGRVTFALLKNKVNIIKQDFLVKPQESNKILGFLDKFLLKNKITKPKEQIKKIIVFKGQGSFTGLRIAAAVAEGLSLAWRVPVKAQNKKAS